MRSIYDYIFVNVARAILLMTIFLGGLVCHAASSDFVIVLDPGHGGKDYGAIGKITNEKTINLAVAKLLGGMIEDEYDDVKVVYTRKTDKFISLKERADIANKAGGHLFISIHVNSVDKKSKNRRTVKGASVYTLGLHRSAANLEVAKRENAVIMLESDYSTTYQGFNPESTESYIMFEMSQNKHMEQSVAFAQEIEAELVERAGRADKGVRQAGFWVLWATGMPSVLVELDFICNPVQEKYMHSSKGQKEMASSIFNAFKRYKSGYDNIMKEPVKALVQTDDTKAAKDNKRKKDKNKSKKKKGKISKENPESGIQRNNSDRETFDAGAIVLSENKENNDSAVDSASTQVKTPPTTEPKSSLSSEKKYKIQFLISNKRLEKGSRSFKGLYPVSCYKDGGVWKYTYGEADNWKEAEKILRKVKDKFPDAFIITMVDGKRL